MPGVGKLFKQAARMQKQMESAQNALAEHEIEVSSGGGAVTVKVNGQGKFLSLKIDPEFLKEEASLVEESILAAVQDASVRAKEFGEQEMQKITAGFPMPGMM